MLNIFKKKSKTKACIIKNHLHKFLKLKNNNLILGDFPKIEKSQIEFNGSNNILFCDEDVILKNTTIKFNGSNSIVFLKKGTYRFELNVHNNSAVYFGKQNYFNPYGTTSKIVLSEEKNLFIGNSNNFSFGLFFRTADPHLIYDTSTHKRINHSKSIYIGDHVWIGQNVTILKGTKIHSGSIIGTQCVISNKTVPSNEIWGGVPAKKIKDNAFWVGKCVHKWTEAETKENETFIEDSFIYQKEENTLAFEKIEEELNLLKTAQEKMEYLRQLPDFKNRFSD